MAGLFIKENLFPKNISKELNKAFYDVSIGFMAPIFFVTAGFSVDVTVFKTDLFLLVLITTLAIVARHRDVLRTQGDATRVGTVSRAGR